MLPHLFLREASLNFELRFITSAGGTGLDAVHTRYRGL